MLKLTSSQLPIYMSEDSFELSFQNQLTCGGSGSKTVNEMQNLFHYHDDDKNSELCYRFYRDITFEKDRLLFQKYDFRYDITVILPGTIQNECKKTSGHYHGFPSNGSYPYPEIYEVLEGHALYILQKAENFNDGTEPVISDLKAVFVEKGQAIIIPPFYGHCSVNVGDGPLVFSNIAVVSCPLYYEPIRDKHGLSLYICIKNRKIVLEKNANYHSLPSPEFVYPTDNPALGIRFGESVYQTFLSHPDRFNYLLNPKAYVTDMEKLLIGKKED